MMRRKTQETEESVDEFIDSLPDLNRREDCRVLIDLFASATKQEPKMWGDYIVGFGKRHYTYANGKPAEICKVGFAPRSKSFAFYLANFPGRSALLNELGKHSFSGGCLHISKLSGVSIEVLKEIIQNAYTKENNQSA